MRHGFSIPTSVVSKLWGFAMRNAFTIWDGLVVSAAAAVLLFLAQEYDLLRSIGLSTSAAEGIELAEVFFIALILGLFLFISVRRMRAQRAEVARRTAAEARARKLAFQDPLTGLANRRQFDEALAAALSAPPGADRTHAVLLLDLNGFKAINDVYGHPMGDAVLKEVALRLQMVVRETGDHVARLGGDEFGIIATHLRGAESATGLALRITHSLEPAIVIASNQYVIGTGIGIALFPKDAGSPEELTRRADIALYRAKSSGRSDFRFFEPDMDVQIRERALIENELRSAVANRTIVPHYQPTIDLTTGAITGFEALARWEHSTLGEIPPSRFIPVAEDCGLIGELGEQLLAKACQDASGWPDQVTLSFNISPVQLRQPTFGLRILAILGETGLQPSRLEIEITENTLVRDLQYAEAALGALREAGVRIALDDFGTGYSSLYHLRRFKFDRIKIDRSFIETMNAESESAAIVKALMGLGHGLGVRVTAEGVERAEQRDALIGEGCDQAQGYMFSRAIPAAEVKAMLTKQEMSAFSNDAISSKAI